MRKVLRLQHHEIGSSLDETGGVPRCLVQIDDARVGRVRGVERKVDRPGELFVRAGDPEGRAAEHVHARLHGDAADLPAHRRCEDQEADAPDEHACDPPKGGGAPRRKTPAEPPRQFERRLGRRNWTGEVRKGGTAPLRVIT
ncbi:MAG: hypothetical protein DMD82_12615 [Candidatus Rokuibacteriota bacterium]|nr:MAG: hypothetical protein DMD82_12615 [Candidatus Rokubacteria bacterium]